MWTMPEPSVRFASPEGVVPEVVEVTPTGRGLARMLGLDTSEELVACLEHIANTHHGQDPEDVLMLYVRLVAGRQMVYLGERVFALTTPDPDDEDGALDTGKRVRLAELVPGVEVVGAAVASA